MKTTEQFIKEANTIHSNKYNYSKVIYTNAHTKVCIICPEHGEFWQTPDNHLHGKGCPKCKFDALTNKNRKSKKQFIIDAKLIHDNKYDYSKVKYVNTNTKVCIICPEHGEFWQTPANHLKNHGCPQCAFEKNKDVNRGNLGSFIKNAKKVHGNKYDYSKVEYINNRTKICIICHKHGEFWQTPHSHLCGCGCPNCQQSKLENKTIEILNKLSIKYINHCNKKTLEWLGSQHLDFYLPDYNVAIECQGIQHYKPIEYFGGKEKFKLTQKLDEGKRNKLMEHNVKLICINYNFNNDKIYDTIINIIKKS